MDFFFCRNEKLNVNKKLVANPHNGHHKFDEKELQVICVFKNFIVDDFFSLILWKKIWQFKIDI